jgi:RING-type zinc-finger
MLPRIAGTSLLSSNPVSEEAERLIIVPIPRFSYGSAEEGNPELDGGRDPEEPDPEGLDPSNHAAATEGAVADNEQDEEHAIALLTRRLRCLFGIITWPIVPLGTIVGLALLWLLYAAFILDMRKSCSHPLHWYVVLSFILVVYAPYHTHVRSRLFRYVRERDGPARPPHVRRFDQFFHTTALLYVYGGITLVQTCREDFGGETSDSPIADPPVVNSCAATCPNLYQALAVYVATLEVFTFSLILPLLFLPCIYLWFLRRATADAEALAVLQDRLREEEQMLRNGGVTADEIMEQLETVKLVIDSRTSGERRILIVPVVSDDLSGGKDANGVKECCICMESFVLQHGTDDIENTVALQLNENDAANEAIVRTAVCGHLFHQRCIASWVGGRWNNGNNDPDEQQRRARRTTCPLCRNDLRPHR